jgi:hypothetical protein
VDRSLLRTWLGLAPGPWPPDHYALLGLPPGECDPAAVESRVLAAMDRLRPHQLLHPELVTEGMNRLAQALVCLTDPVARAAYDAARGFAPARPTPLPPEPSAPIILDADLLLDQPPPPDSTHRVEVPFAPGVAPPEPLPPAYEVVEPLPPTYELVEESDEGSRRPAYEVVEVVEADLVARPDVPWQPATRRQLFARLAAVRRLLAAWRKLKPVLGDPREPLARTARVLVLVEAVAEVRPLLDPLRGVVGEHGRPGGLVAALVARSLVLHTLRLLLPDQRRAVALDWHRGEMALLREYARLREIVRSGRPLRRRSRGRRRVAGWLARTPEFALVALGIAAILVAFLRLRTGP